MFLKYSEALPESTVEYQPTNKAAGVLFPEQKTSTYRFNQPTPKHEQPT